MSLKRALRRMGTVATMALGMGLATAAPSHAVHQTVTGLTTEDPSRIVQFAVGTPGTLLQGAPVAITFPVGTIDDNLIGLDYRPRTNTLYAMGELGTVYVLSPPASMGASWTALTVGDDANPLGDPSNVDTGLDFNPVPDAIRVTNVDDQNFRFSPNNAALLDGDAGTAGVQPDTNLAFATGDPNQGDNPQVGAAAYANNFDGATTTTLVDIEAGNDALVRQGGVNVPPGTPSPNSGQLFTIGTLPGGNVTSVAGLDIETQTGNYYAALQTMGSTSSTFYRLDPATGGALSAFGTIAGGQLIEGVSLPPIPVLQFANATTSVSEGGGTANVTVLRNGPLNQQATVNYATEDTNPGDTATAGDDFTASSGTLTFAPGDASESFAVPIADDPVDESDEALTVRLSMPSASANLAQPPTAGVVIVDDEGQNPGAPEGLVSVPAQTLKKVLRRDRIEFSFSCDEACEATFELSLKGKSLASSDGSLVAAGATDGSLELGGKDQRRVRKAERRSRRGAKLAIDATFTDADGDRASQKVKFRLSR